MSSSRPPTKIAYSNRALRRHVLLGGMLILALTVVWLVHRRAQVPQSVDPVVEARLIAERGIAHSDVEEAELDDPASISTSVAAKRPASAIVPAMALPESSPVKDLKRALKDAQAHLKEGRLLAPPGRNALEIYRAILSAQADNADAIRGIDSIVELLTDQARSALTEGREFEVFELMPLLQALAPESEGVTSLRGHLELLREIEDLLVQAQSAIRDGRQLKPKRLSAVSIYRRVLEMDADNREAKNGLSAVEAPYLQAALAAAQKGRFDDSAEQLAIAARVLKSSDARTRALADIDTARTSRQQAMLEQASAAIQMAQGALAQDSIERAEALGAPRAETRALRAEVARVLQFSRFKPGDVIHDLITTAGEKGPAMVVIPTGRFMMGSAENEKGRRINEGPAHEIEFARGFALAQHETSVAQFARFVQITGYITVAESEKSSALYDERGGRMVVRKGVHWRQDFVGKQAAANAPVLHLAHPDARAYAAWLRQVTGQSYRLPSEAEFEYALRAGSSGRFWWGEDSPNGLLENLTGEKDRSRFRRVWEQSFSTYGDGYWGPAPVAQFTSNPFGLKDMAGNVSEWVEDCWHDSYVRAPLDGSAWVNPGCALRVVRGGSWGSAPLDVRSAYRAQSKPLTRSPRTGFRVARDLVGQ